MLDLPASLWECVHALEAGKGALPASESEAERFVRRASDESLLPLLFQERALPACIGNVLPRFKALERAHEHRSAVLDQTVLRLCECLSDEELILLKGADYRYRLYPHPHLRPMSDIDVLVRKTRMDDIARKLTAAGFEEVFALGTLTLAESYPARTFADNSAAVDLHRTFIQESRHRVDYEEIWSRCEQFTIGSRTAARLSLPHAIVYHALAMAFDEHWVPLIRYVDFLLLVTISGSALEESTDIAARWKARRALYAALRQTSRIFPEIRDHGAEESMAKLLHLPARVWIDSSILTHPREPRKKKTRLRQLWRKLNLIDDWTRRVDFLISHGRTVVNNQRIGKRSTADRVAHHGGDGPRFGPSRE